MKKVEAIHKIPSETSSVVELPKVVVPKLSRKQRFEQLMDNSYQEEQRFEKLNTII
jgi:hypothetical protein